MSELIVVVVDATLLLVILAYGAKGLDSDAETLPLAAVVLATTRLSPTDAIVAGVGIGIPPIWFIYAIIRRNSSSALPCIKM